jgi:hypothetical protein
MQVSVQERSALLSMCLTIDAGNAEKAIVGPYQLPGDDIDYRSS